MIILLLATNLRRKSKTEPFTAVSIAGEPNVEGRKTAIDLIFLLSLPHQLRLSIPESLRHFKRNTILYR